MEEEGMLTTGATTTTAEAFTLLDRWEEGIGMEDAALFEGGGATDRLIVLCIHEDGGRRMYKNVMQNCA